MARVFRTHHGTMVTSDKASGNVVADRRFIKVGDELVEHTDPKSWQKHELIHHDDGTVSVKTSFGALWSAWGGGGQGVACRTPDDPAWTRFGYWIRPDGRVAFQAPNKQWLRAGSEAEGYPLTFTADAAPEDDAAGAYEIFTVEDVAGEQPGTNPRPINGRLRVHGDYQAFGDDSGPRADLYICHMGDLVPRWMYAKLRGDQAQLDECYLDLDDAAEAGVPLIRSWWYLDHHLPGSVWHSSKYEGLDHRVIGDDNFVAWGIELLQAVTARGMRLSMGAGGVGERVGILDADEEAHMYRNYRRIADGAGWETVAFGEGGNEASSGGTSDQNDDSRSTGDNSPENMDRLVRILIDGTDILGHLSYWTNNNYQEAARYLASWQKYNQVHSWRGGSGFNKIDRHFTWCRVFVEQTGRHNGRLTMDTEGPGAPTSPGVPGDRLTMVSATDNGHEMDNPELLALTVVAHNVRGIGCLMSGNGVRRYQRFTEVVGWREVPWTLSQLWPDTHTFTMMHGGQSHPQMVFKATTNGSGVLGRADQAVSPDGRRAVAILYNQHPGQHQAFPVLRSGRVRLLDVGQRTISEHRIHAGSPFEIDAYWGKVALVDLE